MEGTIEFSIVKIGLGYSRKVKDREMGMGNRNSIVIKFKGK